jgi:predicted TIM-barrel fold metal-dependent hydrolase
MVASYKVISADSHIVEPGDLWVNNITPKFRERAPRLVHEETGDVYVCEGLPLVPIPASSAAGKPVTALRRAGRFAEDVRPGAYDPHVRLKDMAIDGVEAEVLYPSMAMALYQVEDLELEWACFSAYNDWLAGFCAASPDRLKGIGMVFTDDVPRATAELTRIRQLGLAGAMVSVAPAQKFSPGQSDLDNFWAVAQDLNLPISLHIATESRKERSGSISNLVLLNVSVQQSLVNLIFGGVFARFPRLRVVSAENDAGWVPYYLERMDYIFGHKRAYFDFAIKDGEIMPSAFFRRNVALTFMRDHTALASRDDIGVQNLMWASDFPHGDSTWPRSRQMIEELCTGIPDADRDRIICRNAASLYGFTA